MKKINIAVSFKDKRGQIIDLIENESISSITIVTFKKGALRGQHFHKKTTQWNYLISGKIRVITKQSNGTVQESILHKGELAVILPKEQHTLIALENSQLFVFTKGPRGGKDYETDTFRLKD